MAKDAYVTQTAPIEAVADKIFFDGRIVVRRDG